MAKAIRDLALFHLERRPEEASRVLERCSAAEAGALLGLATPPVAAHALAVVSPGFAAACFAALGPGARAAVLSELSPTAAGALLRSRPHDAREELLSALPADVAAPIRDLLAYPPGSAGATVLADAVTLFDDLSAERAIEILGGHRDAVPDRVVVLDRSRRVLGVLKTPILCWAAPTASVGSLTLETVPVIPATTPMATLAGDRWEGLPAPVVDRSGAFLGVLNPESLRRVRRHDTARPATQIVAAFSELCWFGLGAMLAGRTPGAPPAESEPRRG